MNVKDCLCLKARTLRKENYKYPHQIILLKNIFSVCKLTSSGIKGSHPKISFTMLWRLLLRACLWILFRISLNFHFLLNHSNDCADCFVCFHFIFAVKKISMIFIFYRPRDQINGLPYTLVGPMTENTDQLSQKKKRFT